MKRVASIIGLRPDHEHEYRELHAAVWPEVLTTLRRANVTNYSIFLCDGLLFAYFEYVGTDFDVDMALIAADPLTQKWWARTDPCQQPLTSAQSGQRWVDAVEVFHLQPADDRAEAATAADAVESDVAAGARIDA